METFTLTRNAHLAADHETGAGAEHAGAESSSLTRGSKLDWMERLMKVSAICAWVTALAAIAAGLPPVSSYAYALDPQLDCRSNAHAFIAPLLKGHTSIRSRCASKRTRSTHFDRRTAAT